MPLEDQDGTRDLLDGLRFREAEGRKRPYAVHTTQKEVTTLCLPPDRFRRICLPPAPMSLTYRVRRGLRVAGPAGSSRGGTLSSEMSLATAGRSMITVILRSYGMRNYHAKNNYHENGRRQAWWLCGLCGPWPEKR